MDTESLICPHCGFELELTEEMNNLQILFCPSCIQEINLSEKSTDDAELAPVFLAEDDLQRDDIVSLLESFGIQSTCKKVPFHLFQDQDDIFIPCEIYVPSQDSENALEIIDNYLRQDDDRRNESETAGEPDANEIAAETLFEEGTGFYEKGDYVTAEAKFQEALQLMPESQDILYNLTLTYIARKKTEQARKIAGRIRFINRAELLQEIKKVESRLFENFCPICVYFNETEGICNRLRENIRRYPKRFVKRCNGKLFKKDLDRFLKRGEVFEQ